MPTAVNACFGGLAAVWPGGSEAPLGATASGTEEVAEPPLGDPTATAGAPVSRSLS